jgi:uncharacterized membrane protein YbhN (UPF0104 family)
MIAMVPAGWGLNALRLYTPADGLGVGIGYRQALQTVVATELASCATPAGTGGPVAFVLLLRRHGLAGARAAAFFAIEQVMDLLFFLGALPIAVILLASRTDLPELGGIATLLGLVLGTGILTVWSLLDHHRQSRHLPSSWENGRSAGRGSRNPEVPVQPERPDDRKH